MTKKSLYISSGCVVDKLNKDSKKFRKLRKQSRALKRGYCV
jgi:hypothetical protein